MTSSQIHIPLVPIRPEGPRGPGTPGWPGEPGNPGFPLMPAVPGSPERKYKAGAQTGPWLEANPQFFRIQSSGGTVPKDPGRPTSPDIPTFPSSPLLPGKPTSPMMPSVPFMPTKSRKMLSGQALFQAPCFFQGERQQERKST